MTTPNQPTREELIATLEAKADRLEWSVSGTAGPSSQEYVSPERFDHYMKMARDARLEANKLRDKSV